MPEAFRRAALRPLRTALRAEFAPGPRRHRATPAVPRTASNPPTSPTGKAAYPDHDLLAHEFTHSWNGKVPPPGRPLDARLPHADARQPALGVTRARRKFWGYILATRAGLIAKEDALAAPGVHRRHL
ncbi:MAG: hypothetical protein WDM96_01825 [Lacunisphaera sp.]